MNNFSRTAMERSYNDFSYLDLKTELFCRLEELKLRLEEVIDDDLAHSCPVIFSDNDLKVTLPEHLYSIRHIKKAIDFTRFDLWNIYGIDTEEDFRAEFRQNIEANTDSFANIEKSTLCAA